MELIFGSQVGEGALWQDIDRARETKLELSKAKRPLQQNGWAKHFTDSQQWIVVYREIQTTG